MYVRNLERCIQHHITSPLTSLYFCGEDALLFNSRYQEIKIWNKMLHVMQGQWLYLQIQNVHCQRPCSSAARCIFSLREVVADLIQPLRDKGYHLYVDNGYTIVTLFQYLFEHSTQACGTICSNCKGYPVPVKQAKLKRGEVIAHRSSELLAMKFKDKRDVPVLTTIHNEEMTPGRNAAHEKPKCIVDHNKYIGGVERTNQLLQPYEIARESLKWYEKIAFHFLQLALLKCFLAFKKNGGQKYFLQFQREVIAVLVFGRDNDNHFDIPREGNVVRVTEKDILWTKFHQQQGREKQRRGADTTTRRISKKNPATTAHANLAYVITFPSKCITQSLCIGLTLKKTKTTHLLEETTVRKLYFIVYSIL